MYASGRRHQAVRCQLIWCALRRRDHAACLAHQQGRAGAVIAVWTVDPKTVQAATRYIGQLQGGRSQVAYGDGVFQYGAQRLARLTQRLRIAIGKWRLAAGQYAFMETAAGVDRDRLAIAKGAASRAGRESRGS